MKNENEMSRITKNYVEICVGISLSAKWYQALRKEIRGRDVKWNPKGRFHITALFADDDSKKEEMTRALDSTLRSRTAPRLTFDKIEVFTGLSGKEHIVNITSSCPEKEFTEMVESIRGVAERLGVSIEDYRLHVTLARVPVELATLEDLKARVEKIIIPKFSLPLTEVRYRYHGLDLEGGLIKDWNLKEVK